MWLLHNNNMPLAIKTKLSQIIIISALGKTEIKLALFFFVIFFGNKSKS